MASFLDKVESIIKNKAELTKRSQVSADWFRRKLRGIRGPIRSALSSMTADKFYGQMQNRGGSTSLIGPGELFCYQYDAKWKHKLKYYDKFPLVMILGISKDGFYGMNFHYLPPVLRAKLLDEIERIGTDKMDWESLSKVALVRPTVKRYLFRHVQSRVIPIEDSEKEITIFLPIENFTVRKDTVWNDSKIIINNFRKR